jgi:hypothetical protein
MALAGKGRNKQIQITSETRAFQPLGSLYSSFILFYSFLGFSTSFPLCFQGQDERMSNVKASCDGNDN